MSFGKLEKELDKSKVFQFQCSKSREFPDFSPIRKDCLETNKKPKQVMARDSFHCFFSLLRSKPSQYFVLVTFAVFIIIIFKNRLLFRVCESKLYLSNFFRRNFIIKLKARHFKAPIPDIRILLPDLQIDIYRISASSLILAKESRL